MYCFFYKPLTNQPRFLEAKISLFGYYDVIENAEAEDFSCCGKLLMGFALVGA